MNSREVVSVTVHRQFDKLEQAHPELFGSDAPTEMFYTPEWFQTLLRHGNTTQGNPIFIVAKEDATNTTLCLPTIDEKHSLKAASNYYASLFGPIGDLTRASPEICNAIARWIRTQPQHWGMIDFSPLEADKAFFKNMQQAFNKQGYKTANYFCFGNWFHKTNGRDFNQYLADRPSELRNTIRRNSKKAEKSGTTNIIIHDAPGAPLDEAIQQFHEIYRNSWKPPESHPEFITELCQIAAIKGWLRLGILTHKGEAIAAQIWLIYAGKANIFKLAYAEGKNPFSAGTLLTVELMRHVIDIDGVGEIDYLPGDDTYKSQWMSQRRERHGLVAFNLRSLSGLGAFAKHQMGAIYRHLRVV